MTLAHERTASGTLHTHWVDCPFCGDDIGAQEPFRQHWLKCSQNPETQA